MYRGDYEALRGSSSRPGVGRASGGGEQSDVRVSTKQLNGHKKSHNSICIPLDSNSRRELGTVSAAGGAGAATLRTAFAAFQHFDESIRLTCFFY